MMAVGVEHFVVVSAVLLALGVAVMVTKRNAIGVLIGVEMVINAAALNFVAFAQLGAGASHIDGLVFAMFIIVFAAAEAAVALAIVLNLYNTTGNIDIEKARTLGESPEESDTLDLAGGKPAATYGVER